MNRVGRPGSRSGQREDAGRQTCSSDAGLARRARGAGTGARLDVCRANGSARVTDDVAAEAACGPHLPAGPAAANLVIGAFTAGVSAAIPSWDVGSIAVGRLPAIGRWTARGARPAGIRISDGRIRLLWHVDRSVLRRCAIARVAKIGRRIAGELSRIVIGPDQLRVRMVGGVTPHSHMGGDVGRATAVRRIGPGCAQMCGKALAAGDGQGTREQNSCEGDSMVEGPNSLHSGPVMPIKASTPSDQSKRLSCRNANKGVPNDSSMAVRFRTK